MTHIGMIFVSLLIKLKTILRFDVVVVVVVNKIAAPNNVKKCSFFLSLDIVWLQNCFIFIFNITVAV